MLEEFELEGTWGFLNELAIGDIETLPARAGVIGRVDSLNGDHNRILVLLSRGQILISV